MIEQILIKNFQSHKDTVLELNPGVNIIVGPTDSGKTAIIRALRWLIWNRPSGDEFRSNWGGETRITVKTDHTIIERVKGKENLYYGDGVKFEAFGAEVPFEIKHLLNMGEINMQSQLDAPFLLTQSPGEVAKHFNAIAHLDDIDVSLKNINRWVQEHNRFIDSEGKRVEKLEKSLEEFKHVDKLDVLLEVLEEQDKQCIQITNSKNVLETKVDIINNVNDILTNLKKDVTIGDTVDELVQLMEEMEEVSVRRDKLNNRMNEINTVTSDIDKKMRFVALEADVEAIYARTMEQNELKGRFTHLSLLKERVQDNENLLLVARNKYDTLHKKFHKELPEVCPLCEQKIEK